MYIWISSRLIISEWELLLEQSGNRELLRTLSPQNTWYWDCRLVLETDLLKHEESSKN